MAKKKKLRSTRTTLAGVAAIGAALLSAAHAHLDGDPSTAIQWEVVITAIAAGAGLIAARDNNRTSEDVGAGR